MTEHQTMIKNDTWYKCTICGREGRVGRCCGDETRIPLNNLAEKEQKHNQSVTHQSIEAAVHGGKDGEK